VIPSEESIRSDALVPRLHRQGELMSVWHRLHQFKRSQFARTAAARSAAAPVTQLSTEPTADSHREAIRTALPALTFYLRKTPEEVLAMSPSQLRLALSALSYVLDDEVPVFEGGYKPSASKTFTLYKGEQIIPVGDAASIDDPEESE
jgi:hypothetical protein